MTLTRIGFRWSAVLALAVTIGLLRPLAVEPHAAQAPVPALAAAILADERLPLVLDQARVLVKTSLTAGSQYPEVWIRDLNTFIDLALDANTQPAIRRALVDFFRFQDDEIGVPDAFVVIAASNAPHAYITSPAFPGVAAFKNTVETDQESSLVQAVARYVKASGDRSILDAVIDGSTVRDRLARALWYPLRHRFSQEYGLIWGATTIDWGDVQPETRAGVYYDQTNSHPAIDVYDNAMFLLAVDAYVDLVGRTGPDSEVLAAAAARIRQNVRTRLWDAARHKFRPHVYLKGSPFPASLDEDRIHYHGGTATAIEAGLLDDREILLVLGDMVEDVRLAGAASIGLSIYPAYPDGLFKHPIIREFAYQNGGDWTWFGARMVQQLVAHGFAAQAYEHVQPMVTRVLRDRGFFEWYTPANEPRGSNAYRGSAGQLGRAIEMLLTWARTQQVALPSRPTP